jgi:hypothetical protein
VEITLTEAEALLALYGYSSGNYYGIVSGLFETRYPTPDYRWDVRLYTSNGEGVVVGASVLVPRSWNSHSIRRSIVTFESLVALLAKSQADMRVPAP